MGPWRHVCGVCAHDCYANVCEHFTVAVAPEPAAQPAPTFEALVERVGPLPQTGLTMSEPACGQPFNSFGHLFQCERPAGHDGTHSADAQTGQPVASEPVQREARDWSCYCATCNGRGMVGAIQYEASGSGYREVSRNDEPCQVCKGDVPTLWARAKLGDEWRTDLLDRGFSNEDADFIVALVERLDVAHLTAVIRALQAERAAADKRVAEARREGRDEVLRACYEAFAPAGQFGQTMDNTMAEEVKRALRKFIVATSRRLERAGKEGA